MNSETNPAAVEALVIEIKQPAPCDCVPMTVPYQRPQGTLRCWFQNKWGFIQLDGFPPGTFPVFVDRAVFQQAGLEPKVGMRLGFDVVRGRPSPNSSETKSATKLRFKYRVNATNLVLVANAPLNIVFEKNMPNSVIMK